MTQQSQTRHRGEFAAADYSQELRGSAQLWDALPPLTEAEIRGAKNAEIEMEALHRVTGGDPALIRKVLAYRREVKQAASVAALTRANGGATGAHPYSLVRQGARGPMASFDTWLARYQSMGRKGREFKNLSYAVKATESGGVGIISGYLSTWGVDQGGDQIMPNAYDATIMKAKAQRDARGGRYLWPILWSHDDKAPIGGWVSAVPDARGLKVTGELDLSTEAGRAAFSAASLGYVDGLSIGYSADKSHWQGNVRVIDQITLYEGSLVTFPMQQNATITDASLN